MAATNCTKEIADFYQLTQSRLARIWERDGKKCRWCDIATILTKHAIPNQATIDHVLPSSRDGANDDSNIVLACLRCNGKRGNSGLHPKNSPLEWRTNFDKPRAEELVQEPVHVELELARKAYKSMKERAEYLESLTPLEVMKMWILQWAFKKLKQWQTGGTR